MFGPKMKPIHAHTPAWTWTMDSEAHFSWMDDKKEMRVYIYQFTSSSWLNG